MNDRGIVKWAPFNSVINGNQLLDEINYERNRISKPVLSEEQIADLEENIIKLNNKSSAYDERNKTVDKLVNKTENCKLKVSEYFIKTQNLIIKNYFDKAFHKINNLEELDNYRRKLEHFRELIGITDGYTFFDDYYTEKMSQLEHKSNVLENGGIETALELKQPSKFGSWFRALKNFVTGEKIHN